jgi:hypothetical protein
MASEKISALPAAGAITGAELVPIVQGGVNVQVSVRTLLAWLTRNLFNQAIPYFDGTDLQGDNQILRFTAASIQAGDIVFFGTLSNNSSTCVMDNGGNIACNTVSPGNGFTGSGIYTNFTVASGVLTAAS